jgi:threonine synthase
MNYVTGLQCHLCKATFPAQALWVCDKCLGPLEIIYDYDKVRQSMTRAQVESRAKNLWRYRELLPIDGEPRTGDYSGYTPLVKADRLAKKLGVRELYLKDDSVNHPTFSPMDRVVSVAATRAVELASRCSAVRRPATLQRVRARRATRLEVFVFIPHDLESSKIWARASTILRSSPSGELRRREPVVHADCREYGWGSRTSTPGLLCEGENLRLRDRRAAWMDVPAARRLAGGRGARCCRGIARAFRELKESAWSTATLPVIHAAQAAGCALVINALNDDRSSPIR